MDRIIDRIIQFAEPLNPALLDGRVKHETRRRLVDALGCMLGALDSEPARIARELASEVQGRFAATAFGLGSDTTVEAAVFANTILVRYLDFNDTYYGPRGGGGHPSDLIPTALAVGEATGASGAETGLLVVLGYEVLSRLQSTVKLRERGWDQGFYTGLAAAVMTGKALGLSPAQLADAASLAVVPHAPMRVTRAGNLSMWKGAATADAARNGVYAARLAAHGMTGPELPFEGEDGVFDQVSGDFELDLAVRPERYVITEIHTKYRPAEYNAQALLDLAVAIRHQVDLDSVRSIHVETYWLGYSEIGSEPAKWDPATRETADHSIPYLLAVALTDGEITLSSFTPQRITDAKLRPLMRKITVAENPSYTERFPGELMVSVDIEHANGRHVAASAAYPRGHVKNPLSDSEIDHKVDGLIAGRSAADTKLAQRARSALWNLDTIGDIGSVLRPLRALQAQPLRGTSGAAAL